jgi:hypothetical protein
MLSKILALSALVCALPLVANARALEKRCGWLDNPTPANYFFTDADASWTIMVQGGRPPVGFDNLPLIDANNFVETNGSYGYGCACLNVVTNARTRHITLIAGGHQLPLKTCLRDANLPAHP